MTASAGVVLRARPGDRVTAGQPLLELHTDQPERIERALAALDGAVTIGAAPANLPLIIDRIEA